MTDSNYSRRYWFTFPTPQQAERPIMWRMSRQFPDVVFDIRQATLHHGVGIMAVGLSGEEEDVKAAVEFLEKGGVKVDPIEKSVIEG